MACVDLTFENSSTKMEPQIHSWQDWKKTLVQCHVGKDEIFSLEMWKATVTEFVATSTFLFTLTTTVIACLESQFSEPRLLVPVAVFIDAFLFLLVTLPISGGHMNPVLSCIAALKGVITLVRAMFYIIAQCVGSVVAYLVIKKVMNRNIVDKYALGGCIINRNGEGISVGDALMVEFACVFLVLYIVITLAFDKKQFKEVGLTVVCVVIAGVYALGVFVSITVTGQAGYGGVGLNPARCLGPAILMGGPLWDGHWVFWFGPFLACLVYYVFSLTLPRNKVL